MKNIIYGIGRHQREMEYIFPELHIDYYLSDMVLDEGDRIHEVSFVLEEKECYRIILCGNEQQQARQLENIGLEHGQNYIYSEELYRNLNGDFYVDQLELPEKIVVWGTGKVSDILRKQYSRFKIQYYIDSNVEKEGRFIDGIEVKHPNSIKDWNQYFIVIAVNVCDSVVDYLNSKKLKSKENYVRFNQMNGAPSTLMRKVCEAPQIREDICMQMFRFAFVGVGGEVHVCCPHMIYNIPAGNLAQNTWEECWNSNVARIMRLSVINKTFCFCDSSQCAHLQGKYERETAEIDDMRDYRIQPLPVPKELVLAFEDSCNLKCVSCRKQFKFKPTEEENSILNVCTNRLKKVAEKVDILTVSGNGDPIFSKYYRELWMNSAATKRKSINLITNGLLFNNTNWERMKDLYENMNVDISIDAATSETYEKIRVGGNFDLLHKNLELLGRLRMEHKINHLMIRFVVQRLNYLEMPKFVELGERIHADVVYFCKIANWNLYSEEEYREMSMYNEKDEMLPELMEVLKNPLFKNPIVNLSNI